MGVCCYWGFFAMTTYNRQPARQRGVEVEWSGVEWSRVGVGACSMGDGGTGDSVYDPGARVLHLD